MIRLLVVDSDGYIQRLARQYLQSPELTVLTASGHEEAMSMLRADTNINSCLIDVFCGQSTEKRSGLELARNAVRLAEERGRPIRIVMTCHKDQFGLIGDLGGLDAHLLKKPFADLHQITEELRPVCDCVH
jgi:CheY-like chemotaxis protein